MYIGQCNRLQHLCSQPRTRDGLPWVWVTEWLTTPDIPFVGVTQSPWEGGATFTNYPLIGELYIPGEKREKTLRISKLRAIHRRLLYFNFAFHDSRLKGTLLASVLHSYHYSSQVVGRRNRSNGIPRNHSKFRPGAAPFGNFQLLEYTSCLRYFYAIWWALTVHSMFVIRHD